MAGTAVTFLSVTLAHVILRLRARSARNNWISYLTCCTASTNTDVEYMTYAVPISYLTCCTASTNTDVEYMTYAVVEHGLSCTEYA